jgi:hypothetical protein
MSELETSTKPTTTAITTVTVDNKDKDVILNRQNLKLLTALRKASKPIILTLQTVFTGSTRCQSKFTNFIGDAKKVIDVIIAWNSTQDLLNKACNIENDISDLTCSTTIQLLAPERIKGGFLLEIGLSVCHKLSY